MRPPWLKADPAGGERHDAEDGARERHGEQSELGRREEPPSLLPPGDDEQDRRRRVDDERDEDELEARRVEEEGGVEHGDQTDDQLPGRAPTGAGRATEG